MDELEILARASLLSPTERESWLDEVCVGRPELRRRIAERMNSPDLTQTPPFASSEIAETLLEAPGARGDCQRDADGHPSGKSGAEAFVERTVGDYRVLKEIAAGGMGVVYAAVHTTLNRKVALKMIKAGGLAGSDGIRRFRLEAEAAARLDHPQIVPVYEVGEAEGCPFFAMGFVDGCSLQEIIKAGPLDARSAAQLLRTICSGIQYAHQKGIIHRDLKPGNILLKKIESDSTHVDTPSEVDGERLLIRSRIGSFTSPRITDFGLAKSLTDESELTMTGQILGTPSYMSPEQAVGSNSVGPLSDVYSLGAILYACLTGRPPFQAASIIETIRLVREVDPPALRVIQPDVPRDLETICLKCLAKNPERRYQSAEELAADLTRWINGLPITARAVGFVERAGKWARRHPAASILGSVTFVVVAVLLGVWAHFTSELAVQRNLAIDRGRAAMDAEKTATLKAEEAQEISSFLLGMFEDADLMGLSGRRFGVLPLQNPPILTIIDRGTERLRPDGPLKDRPILRAALLNKIGDVYLALGDADRAAPLLQEAMVLRLAEWGEEPRLELAEGHFSLGMLELSNASIPEAIKEFRRALEIRTQLLGEEHPETVRAREFLGVALLCTKDANEGLALLDEVVDYYRTRLARAREESSEQVPDLARDLAVALMMLGAGRAISDDADSISELGAEFASLKNDVGHDQLFELGRDYLQTKLAMSIGQYTLAKFSMQSLRAVAAERLGPDHFAMMMFDRDYISILQQLSEFEEAEQIARENLARMTTRLGPDSQMVGEMSYEVARSLQRGRLSVARRSGDTDLAKQLTEEVISLSRRACETSELNQNLPTLQVHQFYLAFVLNRVVDPPQLDEAADLLRKCLRLRRQQLGANDELALIAQARLAACLSDNHQLDAAWAALFDDPEGIDHGGRWPLSTSSDLARTAARFAVEGAHDQAIDVLQAMSDSDILTRSLLEHSEFEPLSNLPAFENLNTTDLRENDPCS